MKGTIKKTKLAGLAGGTRYQIDVDALKLDIFVIRGIKQSKSTAYRKGARLTNETEVYRFDSLTNETIGEKAVTL